MYNWNSIEDVRLRRSALLNEAENARRAADLTVTRQSPRLLRPLLSWTGRRLVTLGFGLLVLAREWDYRSNTVYNGAQSSAQ